MKFVWYGLTLQVPDSVYYPDEDSILLAEAVLETVNKGDEFLEMGCGAGLSSVIAAEKGARVTAADINEEAVVAAKSNAAANDVSVKAAVSDLFSSINGEFDLIAFNPPYLPSDDTDMHLGKSKIQLIGGPTGREAIERFLKEAKAHLNKGGRILLIISSLSGEHEVIAMCERCGYIPSVIKKKKIEWEELIVLELRAEIAKSRRVEIDPSFGVHV
ncbi:MAG TPA: HemK2/MTQ2 family protein methyltransferase [archaeon]|nr:HemK2/MTQ2 family protein methyltransferase [archaeon]